MAFAQHFWATADAYYVCNMLAQIVSTTVQIVAYPEEERMCKHTLNAEGCRQHKATPYPPRP